jgi:hypothetical protein
MKALDRLRYDLTFCRAMRRRNAQLRIVAATIITMIVIILLTSNIYPIDHQCAWQFPNIVSCLLSARETLSAGLIGTGGAVFAGWLAYSAAKESSDRALAEALAAKRAALVEQVNNYATDIDMLRLARGYLENFANKFPPTTQGAPSAGLASALRQVHAQALDVVSSSAIRIRHTNLDCHDPIRNARRENRKYASSAAGDKRGHDLERTNFRNDCRNTELGCANSIRHSDP